MPESSPGSLSAARAGSKMAVMTRSRERQRTVLVVGDVIVVLLTTVTGFANHGELASAGLSRMAATFIPFAFAWFILSPWLGCFDVDGMARPANLWRPPLAAVLAAPLGAIVRGLWRGAPVILVFAVVMGAVVAAAMFVWRLVAVALLRRLTPGTG